MADFALFAASNYVGASVARVGESLSWLSYGNGVTRVAVGTACTAYSSLRNAGLACIRFDV